MNENVSLKMDRVRNCVAILKFYKIINSEAIKYGGSSSKYYDKGVGEQQFHEKWIFSLILGILIWGNNDQLCHLLY